MTVDGPIEARRGTVVARGAPSHLPPPPSFLRLSLFAQSGLGVGHPEKKQQKIALKKTAFSFDLSFILYSQHSTGSFSVLSHSTTVERAADCGLPTCPLNEAKISVDSPRL